MWTFWLLNCITVLGDSHSHAYGPGEEVPVWADRTGPWKSPQEVYSYEELPLCELWNLNLTRRELSLSEVFEGARYTLSPRVRITWPLEEPSGGMEVMEICRMRLTPEVIHSLTELIKDQWYYSYNIDGLPVYAFLGSTENVDGTPIYKFWAHKTFAFERNGNNIISVNIIPGGLIELKPNHETKLTYSVKWINTTEAFATRMKRYYQDSFFETRVQWFSIIISGVFCILLAGILFTILLRTLRDDFNASAHRTDETEIFDYYDEAGWKIISKEVFRKPKHLQFHSIVCGTGMHLACTAYLTAVSALLRTSWGYKSMNLHTLWLAYAVTQPVNGFFGTYIYLMNGGVNWKGSAIGQLLFFPLIILALFLQLNTAYAAYGSTLAVPTGSIAHAMLLFITLHSFLHFVGIWVARYRAKYLKVPVKPNTLERPVLGASRLAKTCSAMLAGALPFGCLMVEAYFVYDCFWTHRSCFMYGFLLAVLFVYGACVAATSVTAVYILLNREDHKWQWYAFSIGASSGLYLLIYSWIYYRQLLANTSGFFHLFTYWVYTGIICLGLALASGAIASVASYTFVRRIYMNVKSD